MFQQMQQYLGSDLFHGYLRQQLDRHIPGVPGSHESRERFLQPLHHH